MIMDVKFLFKMGVSTTTNKLNRYEKKLIAVLATFGMAVSASSKSTIISINGFIDGSQLNENVGDNTQELGIDDLNLTLISSGAVSGLVAVDTDLEDCVDADGVARAGKTMLVSSKLILPKKIVMVQLLLWSLWFCSWFRREDPAGLYTFSRAYGSTNFNLGDVDSAVVDGITVSYSADNFSLAASFEENVDQDIEVNDLNMELSFTFTGFAGVNIGGGYYYDNSDGADADIVNLHASKQIGKLLLLVSILKEKLELPIANIPLAC